MTVAVLVHGNPETAAVWEPLLAELGPDDAVVLSPPGFGAPLPGGFDATPVGYQDWLVEEIERIGEPVDLVGHDWGGAHVVMVAMHRPDLLRSWVSDAVGIFHPDYVWHELARTWQTPGAGEAQITAFLDGGRTDRARRLTERGMPLPVADRVVARFDPSLPHAVLALYRAATQPVMARLGEQLEGAARRPGLAILATNDHVVGTESQRREAAARAGAQVAVFDGLGHQWPSRAPLRSARTLRRFWTSLEGAPEGQWSR